MLLGAALVVASSVGAEPVSRLETAPPSPTVSVVDPGASDTEAPLATVGGGAEPPAPPPEPKLPRGIKLGVNTVLPVPGDKALFVVHAPADNRQAIIYLHGMCGNVHAVDVWKDAVTSVGTLITLLGDRPCGRGRYRWGKSLTLLESRIERALEVVKEARGGLLDTEHPVLFGYSQGASRAEGLAAENPTRYQRVVLGGAPREPRLAHLGAAQAIAVFGGELETFGHMRAGAEVLAAAGKTARFFLFPKAKHGDFGPAGKRVMGEVFAWLMAADEASANVAVADAAANAATPPAHN